MEFNPTHKHKEIGEAFEFAWQINQSVSSYYSSSGELRSFKRTVMAPIHPIEEWEPVDGAYVTSTVQGILKVHLKNEGWMMLPHPDVRLVDGCRLERRKR